MTAEATGACPECGEEIQPGDDFCEGCGRPLTARSASRPRLRRAAWPAQGPGQPPPGPPPPATVTTRDAGAAKGCAGCGAYAISEDGYCERCGLLQPDERDHVEVETAQAAGVSNRGLRHSRNEDAVALAGVTGAAVAVVSDGVSSAPTPEDASRVAAQTGVAVLAEQIEAGADPEAATLAAAHRAAKAVSALAESEHHAPACTYVSVIARPEGVTVGWIGDSRAYWLPRGGAGGRPPAVLTVDDSWAAQMVTLGVMTEEEASHDHRAHTLTSWLGADAGEIAPHVTTFAPGGPGTIVACSDGLWNYLPAADELAAAAPGAAAGTQSSIDLARSLVRTALDAGGRDNVTVVVIPFPPP